MTRCLLAAAVLLTCSTAALAQEQPPIPPPRAPSLEDGAMRVDDSPAHASASPESHLPPDLARRDPAKWQIDLEPAAWYVGISGRVRLPRSTAGSSPERHLEDFNLDNPRFDPIGEVNVRRGDWRGTLRGAFYGADKESTDVGGRLGDVTFTPGDRVRTSLDFTVIEAEGAYTMWGRPQVVDGEVTIDPRIDLVAGVRVYGDDYTIENLSGPPGRRQEMSEWFIHPLVGVKVDLELYRDFTIDVQVTGGGMPGGRESYGFDIIAGFMWRPIPNVGVQIGYRSLFFGASKDDGNDEASLDGALQGLYFGATFRF